MKAVVFDLDGTLLDVREAFYWQFERLSEEFDGAALARSVIAASAHGTTETVTPNFQHAIPNIPGKSLTAVVVDYPPGAASPRRSVSRNTDRSRGR